MTYYNQADKIYAQALLELDLDKEQILNEFYSVQEVFNSSDELVNILANPTINISKRNEIIQDIFAEKINEKLVRFLQILVEKNKINRFNEILECYLKKYNENCGIKEVEIISAININQDYKDRILLSLKNKLNKDIKPQWTINPDIIGGLIFKAGDTVIDTSLKYKIESFNNIMK